MRLTGRQWHDRDIKVGEVLISDSGKRYRVYEDTRGARCIEGVIDIYTKHYLFPMTATYFTKETKMAVDWTKPIECKAANWKHLDLRFVGVDPFDPEKVIVCLKNGNTYKVNKLAGIIADGYVVTNKLEPWEEAFEKCFKGTSMQLDTNIEEAFHEGFEAGLTYALGTVK